MGAFLIAFVVCGLLSCRRDSLPFKAAILVIAAVATACGPVVMGPFYPAHPRVCGADPDCPVHERCAFVAGHPQAVCLPGDSDLDSYKSGP